VRDVDGIAVGLTEPLGLCEAVQLWPKSFNAAWAVLRIGANWFGGRFSQATWLILPVVICLSQRLSHACLSISDYTVKLRMAH
jgi:hypothetical protein